MPEMTRQDKLQLAHAALEVVGERWGFMLAGSLAMDLWDLTPRAAHDIDLFAEPQRGRVIASEAAYELLPALTDAGFEVRVEDVTAAGRNVEFEVTDPRSGASIGLQLVEMTGVGQPAHCPEVGPVLSLDSSIELKIEAFTARRAPKDYVDLAHIAQTASGYEDETHILDLLSGASADVDLEKYRAALRSAGEMPERFLSAAYGAEDVDVPALRETLTLLATTVGATADDTLHTAVPLVLGEEPLTEAQTIAAANRIEQGAPYTLLSDADLFMVGDERFALANLAVEAARDARAVAERDQRDFEEYGGGLTAAVLRDISAQFPGLADRAVEEATEAARASLANAHARADELEAVAAVAVREAEVMSTELGRREALTSEERAAETVLRRTFTEAFQQQGEVDHAVSEQILQQDALVLLEEQQRQDQGAQLQV